MYIHISKIFNHFSGLRNCCSRPCVLHDICISYSVKSTDIQAVLFEIPLMAISSMRRVIHAVRGFTCLPQFPMSSSLGLRIDSNIKSGSFHHNKYHHLQGAQLLCSILTQFHEKYRSFQFYFNFFSLFLFIRMQRQIGKK